jgi:hypothetical protein
MIIYSSRVVVPVSIFHGCFQRFATAIPGQHYIGDATTHACPQLSFRTACSILLAL